MILIANDGGWCRIAVHSWWYIVLVDGSIGWRVLIVVVMIVDCDGCRLWLVIVVADYGWAWWKGVINIGECWW